MKSGTDMEKEQPADVRPIVWKEHKLLVALVLLVLFSVQVFLVVLGIHLKMVVFSWVVVVMFSVVYFLISGKVDNDGELNPQVAIHFTTKTAKDVMIPIESTFSVSLAANLDWQVPLSYLSEIIAKDYSLVPVYSMKPTNMLCVVETKTLRNRWIPEAKIPVTSLPIIRVPRVRADMPLHEVFTLFRKKGTNMATVVKDVSGPMTRAQVQLLEIEGRSIGIITFQDVIQELLKDKPVLATMIGEIR